MSKFKKGDWVLEGDAEVGRDMLHHGYLIHDVLPNGKYVVQVDETNYEVWSDSWFDECTVEPRCTGWDWVLPDPANRFGLKVGDTVTIKPHDAKDGHVSTSHVIAAIEDTYNDGIARFSLDDTRSSCCWHPYYFGLCQSDGSPLPPKSATKTVVLEEWCYPGENGRSYGFIWRDLGSPATDIWFKTGVTRELEVPNE